MLSHSRNPLENALNSKFVFKLDTNCKSIVYLGEMFVCIGLDNGAISIFSIEKFKFILTQQIFEGAIIYLEVLRMKDNEKETNSEEKSLKKSTILVQGKEGDLALITYNFDSNSVQTIFKWKEESIVGFTKLTINNKIWKENKENSSLFVQEDKIYESLDKIRLFYPDNDGQKVEAYQFDNEKFKKEEIMIPPPRTGAKEISICCLKYVSFEHDGKVSEVIFTAEENSRFGVIFGTMNKFASSKFKEIYQHNKQTYTHFILPYKVEKEDDKLLMKLIIGLNIEESLVLSLNLQSFESSAATFISLSSSIKPGITNGLVFRDGKYILISTSEFKVKICRTKDFKQIVSLNLHDNFINDILLENIAEKNEYLFTCSEDRDFSVMDLSSLKKS